MKDVEENGSDQDCDDNTKCPTDSSERLQEPADKSVGDNQRQPDVQNPACDLECCGSIEFRIHRTDEELEQQEELQEQEPQECFDLGKLCRFPS